MRTKTHTKCKPTETLRLPETFIWMAPMDIGTKHGGWEASSGRTADTVVYQPRPRLGKMEDVPSTHTWTRFGKLWVTAFGRWADSHSGRRVDPRTGMWQ